MMKKVFFLCSAIIWADINSMMDQTSCEREAHDAFLCQSGHCQDVLHSGLFPMSDSFSKWMNNASLRTFQENDLRQGVEKEKKRLACAKSAIQDFISDPKRRTEYLLWAEDKVKTYRNFMAYANNERLKAKALALEGKSNARALEDELIYLEVGRAALAAIDILPPIEFEFQGKFMTPMEFLIDRATANTASGPNFMMGDPLTGANVTNFAAMLMTELRNYEEKLNKLVNTPGPTEDSLYSNHLLFLEDWDRPERKKMACKNLKIRDKVDLKRLKDILNEEFHREYETAFAKEYQHIWLRYTTFAEIAKLDDDEKKGLELCLNEYEKKNKSDPCKANYNRASGFSEVAKCMQLKTNELIAYRLKLKEKPIKPPGPKIDPPQIKVSKMASFYEITPVKDRPTEDPPELKALIDDLDPSYKDSADTCRNNFYTKLKPDTCKELDDASRDELIKISDPKHIKNAKVRYDQSNRTNHHDVTDCSHFLHGIMGEAGFNYPPSSTREIHCFRFFKKISVQDLKKGDIVHFFETNLKTKKKRGTHVGFYVAGDELYSATGHSKKLKNKNVETAKLSKDDSDFDTSITSNPFHDFVYRKKNVEKDKQFFRWSCK